MAAQHNPQAHNGSFLSRRSLRTLRILALFFTTAMGIAGLVLFAYRFSMVSEDGVSSGMKALSIIIGLAYLSFFIVEVGGLYAGIKNKPRLLRIYWLASLQAIGLFGLATILSLVYHFAFKWQIKSQCTLDATGSNRTLSGDSDPTVLSQDQAVQWCDNDWKSHARQQPLAVVFAFLLPALTSLLVYAYYKKLVSIQDELVDAVDPYSSSPETVVPLQNLRPVTSVFEQAPPYSEPPSTESPYHPGSKSAEDQAWNDAVAVSEKREREEQAFEDERARSFPEEQQVQNGSYVGGLRASRSPFESRNGGGIV